MTVVAAWIREVGETQELVFVSDSRLRWAGSWDSCPKIFLLPRSDALMAFAGDTLWAYPIIAQTINNITAFEPSRERRYDLLDAKGHALRVINDMVGQGDAIDGPDPPDETADFLFGGFSAREGRFRLWRFFFDGPAACFRAERIRPRRIGTVRFIGDVGPQASRRLYEQMDSLGKDNGPLDFEPLAVVRELLREASRDSTIGGPLQVAKAYRHMNTEAFAVRWSSEPGEVSARLSFLGRPLLEYEELGVPLLDPDRPAPELATGRGEELISWDADLVAGIAELQVADPDSLRDWSEANAKGYSPLDIDEWLDYALRRGVIESPTAGQYVTQGAGGGN